jgi:hypothetical protein
MPLHILVKLAVLLVVLGWLFRGANAQDHCPPAGPGQFHEKWLPAVPDFDA